MNSTNFGIATGRLARDPFCRTNNDGSKSYSMVLACENNFKSKDGSRGCHYVTVKRFVPAGSTEGIMPKLHKGDLVSTTYTVQSGSYQDKDGQTVYTEEHVLTEMPTLLAFAHNTGDVAPEDAAQAAAPEELPQT